MCYLHDKRPGSRWWILALFPGEVRWKKSFVIRVHESLGELGPLLVPYEVEGHPEAGVLSLSVSAWYEPHHLPSGTLVQVVSLDFLDGIG